MWSVAHVLCDSVFSVFLSQHLDSWGSRRLRVHSCHTWAPPRLADTHTVLSAGCSSCSGTLQRSTDRLQKDTGLTSMFTWREQPESRTVCLQLYRRCMTHVYRWGNRSNRAHTGHMTLRYSWVCSDRSLMGCSWCSGRSEDHRNTLRKTQITQLFYQCRQLKDWRMTMFYPWRQNISWTTRFRSNKPKQVS